MGKQVNLNELKNHKSASSNITLTFAPNDSSVSFCGCDAAEDSAWVVVDGKVYDVTGFLDDHPGGKKILLKNCGKDATEAFWTYHGEKVLEKVGADLQIGEFKDSAKL